MHVFLTHSFHWAHNLNVSAYLIFVVFFNPRTISQLIWGKAVEVDAAFGHVAQRCSLQRCEHVLSACK